MDVDGPGRRPSLVESIVQCTIGEVPAYMRRDYIKWYSPSLHRDMELLAFGHAGFPVVVFPTSGGRFWEYEERGMVGALAPAASLLRHRPCRLCRRQHRGFLVMDFAVGFTSESQQTLHFRYGHEAGDAAERHRRALAPASDFETRPNGAFTAILRAGAIP